MTQIFDERSALTGESTRPRGRVLKGQYVGAFRSRKGKLKGLRLQTDAGEFAVKLPKYLRPMLVSDLTPGAFLQIWVYPDEDSWRGINIFPLPEIEARSLQLRLQALTAQPLPEGAKPTPKPSAVLRVCCKGTCSKRGSREVLHSLQAAVAQNPDLQNVSVKATGCLKACKRGPNLEILPEGRILSHATPQIALSILSEHQP